MVLRHALVTHETGLTGKQKCFYYVPWLLDIVNRREDAIRRVAAAHSDIRILR